MTRPTARIPVKLHKHVTLVRTAEPAAVEAMAARVPIGSRLALSLFAVTEARSMSLAGLAHALGILGAEPAAAIVRLLDLGLLAIEPSTEVGPIDDFPTALKRGDA